MKPKKIPNVEAKSGEVQRLKRRINKLEKENARLKSEIRTLEGFRDATSNYIDGKLDGVSVENVIKGIDKKLKLSKIESKDLKIACPKCITKELAEVPYRAGKILICRNCDYRETKKE